MPHIFRFHTGRNNNIFHWTPSDRISSEDLRSVADKTNVLSSSAGTSIPTPLGRMFLFKTAFEIVAAQVRDNQVPEKSIYTSIVSETLDLLELLFKSGADSNRFRFQRWLFDNTQQDDHTILKHFGTQYGHRLLAESFKLAAGQAPFHNKIEITLIYYREGGKELLLGGTSPFSFLFTSPNFKRKWRERRFKFVSGMTASSQLFTDEYRPLQERDASFIKYVESLVDGQGTEPSFSGFTEYVVNTRLRFHDAFNGEVPALKDIHFEDRTLSASGVPLRQLSELDLQQKIAQYSDFKLALPADTHYAGALKPLFLLDKMNYIGQYTSPASLWQDTTRVTELAYPETTLNEVLERDLPGLEGVHYPFLSGFDFFERCLIKLPGYALNDARFVTLSDNQTYLLPLKPLFFHFFPINRLKEYVSVERVNTDRERPSVTFRLRIPVHGATKGPRDIIVLKTYEAEEIVQYGGILGLFPLTRAQDTSLGHINKYTVASYEKTNDTVRGALPLESLLFWKGNAVDTIKSVSALRSEYGEINTRSSYYQLDESFDMMQLRFLKGTSVCSGLIIPIFREVGRGTEAYVYAIDFGTSNTHIEYGKVVNGRVTDTQPFSIGHENMQMALLNKPLKVRLNDGAQQELDFVSTNSLGDKVDTARRIVLREFVPFQVGTLGPASVKFPFRTAICESQAFLDHTGNGRLFLDANIGFSIDSDALFDYVRYQTNLKWLLERDINDPHHQQRVRLFFRQLLLMIRTRVLLEPDNQRGDLSRLQIALSFPVSMGSGLREKLYQMLQEQCAEIIGAGAPPVKRVTESIAPYYHIKHHDTNIQIDSCCNIDIGGGTTDVVLIEPNPADANELLCYCSSFKFAGRQLWSSGRNEFSYTDNGFVGFFRQFFQEKYPDRAGDIAKLFQQRQYRTEDVVGLLFSDADYHFNDIFAECKELKVPLLVHYCAILFYITKMAAHKKMTLPRTLSFSGKGSEYLGLLFQNNQHLKGFTQRVLSLFAGTPTRNDFQIQRSPEPKVITAKGAAHFAAEDVQEHMDEWGNGATTANREKVLKLVEFSLKGFRQAPFEEGQLTYGNLGDRGGVLLADIMTTVQEFIDLLFDNAELCNLINKNLELRDFASYKSFFLPDPACLLEEGPLRDSFMATLTEMNAMEKVADVPFFFAFNYSLIQLSRHIAEKNAIEKVEL